jgi:peptide/nickel transport system permease protein
VLIWLLVLAADRARLLSARNPLLARPGSGSAAAGRDGVGDVLLAFVVVGLLDSLHYRPRLENAAGQHRPGQAAVSKQPAAVYAVEVLSLLDALLTPLRTRNEKTYSEPLATRAYAKESIECAMPTASFSRRAIIRA